MDDNRLLYRIDEAKRATGLGTTRLYELLGAGILDGRKCGTRTLITAASLHRYVENLPKAGIRTGRKELAE